jgi:hypothetical protein
MATIEPKTELFPFNALVEYAVDPAPPLPMVTVIADPTAIRYPEAVRSPPPPPPPPYEAPPPPPPATTRYSTVAVF